MSKMSDSEDEGMKKKKKKVTNVKLWVEENDASWDLLESDIVEQASAGAGADHYAVETGMNEVFAGLRVQPQLIGGVLSESSILPHGVISEAMTSLLFFFFFVPYPACKKH